MSPRWALASPLSPPSPLSSRHSLQLSLHLQLLLGLLPGPLPRAERSAAQTYHAVLLVPRGVGQGARGRGRPAVLFVCAGPIGCKEKGPRWAVRGGRTTRAGCGRFCTWARQGPPRTALALSLEAPCPRPAAPRQRGLRPLSWYSSLVVQAPLRPPPPACHLSCPEKALGRGPCGNRGSPLSCCRQQPEAHNGPTGLGPTRAQMSQQPRRHGCIIQASVGCPVSGPGSRPGIRQPGRGSWAGLGAGSALPQH